MTSLRRLTAAPARRTDGDALRRAGVREHRLLDEHGRRRHHGGGQHRHQHWSGLPVAIGSLGTALAAWPLSRLMVRFGRRPGLTTGYAVAVAGAILGIVGVVQQSFALFLTGTALFGTANTSNLPARYAAADITPGARRGRAIGLIVWGSAAGSIVGPC